MNVYKSYAIISLDESISLTKYGEITIPSEGRYLDGREVTDQLCEKVSKKLAALGISESSDYILARFPMTEDKDFIGRPYIKLSVFDLDGLFCLDEQACRFYETKVGGGYHYTCSDFKVDIEASVRESNRNRVLPILSDVFNIGINEIEDFSTQVENGRFFNKLAEFKRECTLPKEDYAFLNDVVTLGTITVPYGAESKREKFEKHYASHKAGKDVARESKLLKELSGKNNLCSLHDIMNALEMRLSQHESSLPRLETHFCSINDLKGSQFHSMDISYTILSFIYLKSKALYQELAERDPSNILTALAGLYTDITTDSTRKSEATIAYYVLICELGWSNLADSYYRWKKLSTFKEPAPYIPIGDKVKELKVNLESAKSELSQRQVTIEKLQDQLAEMELKLKREQSTSQELRHKLQNIETEYQASHRESAKPIAELVTDKQQPAETDEPEYQPDTQLTSEAIEQSGESLPANDPIQPIVNNITLTQINKMNKDKLKEHCVRCNIELKGDENVRKLKDLLKNSVLAQG